MRILLVDDDTSVLQGLLGVLRTLPGQEVRGAVSGEKALEQAAALGGLDILITDVVMDPVDGFTLRDQLLALYPGMRTILISGYDLSDYQDQLTGSQFLQKPVSPEALTEAVRAEMEALAPASAAAIPGAARLPNPLKSTGPIQPLTAVGSGSTASAAGDESAVDHESADHESSAGLMGYMIGGYQIVSELGEGRWGTTYAAVQTSINRPVGLKILDPARGRDEAQRLRFIADARAKAHVQHPSILAVYEAGTAEGWIFYTHEYVDGQNSAEMAAAGQTVTEVVALKIMRVVADGFIYLTRNNIPHTALQATDIYLGRDGNPRLANLATSQSDPQAVPEREINALAAAMRPLLPAQGISTGLRTLLGRMYHGGANGVTGWGAVLQAVKALEPKVVPIEAAKISAQDRAAEAAVQAVRRQQKRSLYLNIGSIVSLLILVGVILWLRFGRSNERFVSEQIHIPAGTFVFGNGETRNLDEFWIDRYEITIGEYAKFLEFLEKNPDRALDFNHEREPRFLSSHAPKGWETYYERAKAGLPVHSVPSSLNSPVMVITWWDAYAYAKWRGRELPDEYQWEKAARGTAGFAYPWGNEPEAKKANTGVDHNPREPGQEGAVDGYNFWNDVDELKGDESPFNVRGMMGNVSEWTATWTPDKRFPIIKGGNFKMPPQPLSSRIDNKDPNTGEEFIGFRTISRKAPAK